MAGEIRIVIAADVRDPVAALTELARVVSTGEMKLAGVCALVGDRRLEPEGGETPEAFGLRVRSTVTELRAGFSIQVEA